MSVARRSILDPENYQKFLEDVAILSSILKVNPPPQIWIEPDKEPRAFVPTAQRIIVLTTSLVNMLDEEELLGVLSHELQHIRNREDPDYHLTFKRSAAVAAGAAASITISAARRALANREPGDPKPPETVDKSRRGFLATTIKTAVAGGVGYCMERKREELDANLGAIRTGKAEGLARALEKIKNWSDERSKNITLLERIAEKMLNAATFPFDASVPMPLQRWLLKKATESGIVPLKGR